MSVRSLLGRVQRLEQAGRPSVFAAMWAEAADAIQAEIDGGSADTDKPTIVAALRRWVRDGMDRQ